MLGRNISLHGFATIYMSNSIASAFLWSVVFLASLTGLLVNFGLLLNQLDDKNVVEIREIYFGPQPFPAVTLCNLNAYKRTALARVPKLVALNEAYKSIANDLLVELNTSESSSANIKQIETKGLFREKRSSEACFMYQNLILYDISAEVGYQLYLSKAECCDFCKNTPACLTWISDSFVCHLFSKIRFIEFHTSMTSGIPRMGMCHSVSNYRVVGDTGSNQLTYSCMNESCCCQTCVADAWCMAWTFAITNSSCQLFNSITGDGFDSDNYTSGVVFKECGLMQCEHGSECSNNSNGQVGCNCTAGFKGELCQFESIECQGQCRNSLKCLEKHLDYECVCKTGYTGKNCSIDINECQSNPCGPSGMCYDGENQYLCTYAEEVTINEFTFQSSCFQNINCHLFLPCLCLSSIKKPK